LGISSIILIVISVLSYFLTLGCAPLFVIISRIFMFVFLYIFKNKLVKINRLYYKLWNRNNKPKKIKSTTFRALNVVIFNISFSIINLGMILSYIIKNWR
ncbi:MAG: hypothetical protein K2P14_05230, partial [Anaeroplasmataceae bacterium]|nr:hypothetical protein [Anaeroplasmataceae bacterium]